MTAMRQTALEPHEIRNLRRMLRLTQARFGQFFGRDQATVFRWENGIYQPDPASAAALVRLWNDVHARYPSPQEQKSEKFATFVTGLIAGGVFAYLLTGVLPKRDE